MRKHRHASAFRVMPYRAGDGSELEFLWNSRDGQTPAAIASAKTAKELEHRGPDLYAPLHVPKVGDRIFVDLTEQRARVRAALCVEHWEELERNNDPIVGIRLHQMFENREAAIQCAFETLFKPGAPDILVVTAGYREQLLQERAERCLEGQHTSDLMSASDESLRVAASTISAALLVALVSRAAPNVENVHELDITCSACGADHGKLSRQGPGRGPLPGDIAVCAKCGLVARLDATMTLCPVSEAERAQCPADALEWSERIKRRQH